MHALWSVCGSHGQSSGSQTLVAHQSIVHDGDISRGSGLARPKLSPLFTFGLEMLACAVLDSESQLHLHPMLDVVHAAYPCIVYTGTILMQHLSCSISIRTCLPIVPKDTTYLAPRPWSGH